MADLLNNIFTNTETLTPLTVLELFAFFGVVELLGIFLSWMKGRK